MITQCFKYRLTKYYPWQYTMPIYGLDDVDSGLWIVLTDVVTLYRLSDKDALDVEVQILE